MREGKRAWCQTVGACVKQTVCAWTDDILCYNNESVVKIVCCGVTVKNKLATLTHLVLH